MSSPHQQGRGGQQPPAGQGSRGGNSYGMQYGGYRASPAQPGAGYDDNYYDADNYELDRGPSGGGRQRRGLISGIVRGVASGIGLAAESYQHHQEKKKAAAANAAAAAPASSSSSSTRDDGAAAVAGPSSSLTAQGYPQEKKDIRGRGAGQEEDNEDDESSSDEDEVPVNPEMSRDIDEATWQLDEAQTEMTGPPPDYAAATNNTSTTMQDVPAMADTFVRMHPPPSYEELQRQQQQEEKETGGGGGVVGGRLPMPVILPQRRPGARARGFIQAYAPLLREVGIDEVTFRDFVRDLNKAAMPSPWINAINMAALAAQHVPEPVTIAVSIAAQVTTKVALQTHSRTKTNDFLDRTNRDFFRPRGLIAVVMTWKPSQPGEVVTQVDFDAALGQAASTVLRQQQQQEPRRGSPVGASLHKVSHALQASNATTHFEWPESAPLVFPALDHLAGTQEGQQMVRDAAAAAGEGGGGPAGTEQGKKPSGMARGMLFVMEYMDKRAQADFAARNPDSRMAELAPRPEFHSRYADPNHPASSGSLIALLTGGHVGGRPQYQSARRQGRRERHAARRQQRRGQTVLGTVGPGALVRGVRKYITEDVLYLMIVNLPSEQEMAQARQFMAQQPQGVRW